jgi:hypothetical protein
MNFINGAMSRTGITGVHRLGVYYFFVNAMAYSAFDDQFRPFMNDELKGGSDDLTESPLVSKSTTRKEKPTTTKQRIEGTIIGVGSCLNSISLFLTESKATALETAQAATAVAASKAKAEQILAEGKLHNERLEMILKYGSPDTVKQHLELVKNEQKEYLGSSKSLFKNKRARDHNDDNESSLS